MLSTKAAKSEYVAPKLLHDLQQEQAKGVLIDAVLVKMDLMLRNKEKNEFDAEDQKVIKNEVAALKEAMEGTKKVEKKIKATMGE